MRFIRDIISERRGEKTTPPPIAPAARGEAPSARPRPEMNLSVPASDFARDGAPTAGDSALEHHDEHAKLGVLTLGVAPDLPVEPAEAEAAEAQDAFDKTESDAGDTALAPEDHAEESLEQEFEALAPEQAAGAEDDAEAEVPGEALADSEDGAEVAASEDAALPAYDDDGLAEEAADETVEDFFEEAPQAAETGEDSTLSKKAQFESALDRLRSLRVSESAPTMSASPERAVPARNDSGFATQQDETPALPEAASEPAPIDPAPAAEPAGAEAVPVEPEYAESASVDPAPVEPEHAKAAPGEPAPAEAAPVEPESPDAAPAAAQELSPELAEMPFVTVGEPAAEPAAPARASGDIHVPPPAAGRGSAGSGRVKTRLLGFNPASLGVSDPFEKAAAAPNRDFPVAWLVVVSGPGRGASFAIHDGVSRIGRGTDQSVPLAFGDTAISRENHASIAYDPEENTFYIGQSGKANIVRLNSKPLLSTEQLQSGDQIRLGETTLRFVALCNGDFRWSDGA